MKLSGKRTQSPPLLNAKINNVEQEIVQSTILADNLESQILKEIRNEKSSRFKIHKIR